jgi:hypothetical protein
MSCNGETSPIEMARRLIDKIQRDPANECWEWIGARGHGGYGQIRIDGQVKPAYRATYELFVGPIPKGKELDHLCRNPACVNPKHLEPVSHVENVRRGNAGANNRDKTHCPHGHAYDDENTIYNAHGGRVCRTCSRRRSREWQMNTRLMRRANKFQTNGGHLGI